MLNNQVLNLYSFEWKTFLHIYPILWKLLHDATFIMTTMIYIEQFVLWSFFCDTIIFTWSKGCKSQLLYHDHTTLWFTASASRQPLTVCPLKDLRWATYEGVVPSCSTARWHSCIKALRSHIWRYQVKSSSVFNFSFVNIKLKLILFFW
jgi:hypothetical protein